MLKYSLKIVSVLSIFAASFYMFFHSKKVVDPMHLPSENNLAFNNKEDAVIAKKLDQFLKDNHFNGTALVMDNNDPILHKGYGYADAENEIVATSKTKYRIGSITKTVVAVSILQLQKQGKVNIYDNVNNYIPFFPADKQITLAHLLTHTSGLPKKGEGKVDASNRDELISWIGNQKLIAPAGEKWNYVDYNYMVLAYIVETVTGKSINEYVTEHIFEPLGMEDSGLGEKKLGDTFLAKGYTIKDHLFKPSPRLAMKWLYGCGEMYTTVEDMKKLDEAMENGTLISKKTLEEALQMPSPKKYFIGFYLRPGFNHNHGVLSGWNTFNNFNWEKQRYVILFSNVKNSMDDKFNEKFRDLVNTLLDDKNKKKALK